MGAKVGKGEDESEGEAKGTGKSKRTTGRTVLLAMKKFLIRLRCSNTTGPTGRIIDGVIPLTKRVETARKIARLSIRGSRVCSITSVLYRLYQPSTRDFRFQKPIKK